MLSFNQGDLPAAAAQFQKALDIDPDYAMAQNNVGITLMASGQYHAAAERFRKAIALDPDFAQPHANLGYVLGRLDQSAAAVNELRGFLRRQPDNPKVLTWLAWVLATARDDAVRDGREALDLARRAAARIGESDPNALDALAAAQAETGDFPAAVKTAQAARESATAAGQPDLAADIQERIQEYHRSQPFRQKLQ